MHRLVPSLIIDNLSEDNLRGSFPCTGLFVDVSGFTQVTETLMSQGQHGAEVMAAIMRTIFNAPVHSVFEHGGFVTNFAGDAFTAVFPSSEARPANPGMRALAAAWLIQKHMADNAVQRTRYGTFEFSVKIGLAEGEADWGILPGDNGQRAAYYFKGSAIIGSANAEHHALAGDIIGNQAVFETISRHVRAQPAGDHWRITHISTTLPEPLPVELPPPDLDQMVRFFPRTLLEQEISGEFRQVLNLFINLQGTPDHEQLMRFAQHLFQLQDRYGGVLSRIDFADKGCHMLFFWGAPTSHENDITRVLDFILECHRLSEVPLRAGITYRIAHAGSIGSELAEEYTCYGRGVNLAARYMTTADWDEIWVDGEIARRAEGEFTIQSLGPKQFKGFAEPQLVFLLTGHREDVPSPFGDRPLAGRQKELTRLQEAVQPIYDGRFGGVVTIIGEAGIGKSRLVHESLDPIAGAGETAVFLCQTDEIIRKSLNPFRYFLRHYFDQSTSEKKEDNKRRFSEILDDLMATVSDSGLKDELERTSSFLGRLVGLYWEGSLYEQLEPELRFENSLIAIKTLFRAESRRQPVIIQLEDAHWLDPDSEEFLGSLTRNMADFPLILLVTSREELAADLFALDAPFEAIHLQALGRESLEDMAQAITGSQPSSSLLQLLEERSGGNPFYAEQLLLYLQENDLLQTVSDQVEGVLPGDVYIPTDVRALLTARLDRLPAPVKEVVQNAAVLGREFESPILYNMMAKDPGLEKNLATAAEESIWIALDQDRYLFQHALLRDAAYDMQLHFRLRQLHKLAALAFEDQYEQDPALDPRYAEIAYHFDKAEETDQARSYYGQAGDRAKGSYHNQEAITYFSRALALTEEEDFESKYTFLCGREPVYKWLGWRDQQESDLLQLGNLLENHANDQKQADLALRKSAFELVTGDYDGALFQAHHALNFAVQADDTITQARAYHRWGRTLWQQGHSKEAEGYLHHALDLAHSGGSRSVEADCLFDLGTVFRTLARYNEAISILEKAAAVYAELDNKRGLVRCQNLFGVIDNEQGDLLGSFQHYLQALELCRDVGWRYAETYILINIGNSDTDLGDYENALSYHSQALDLSKETGDRHAESVSLDSLGLVSFYESRFAAAITYYQQALEILESVSNQRSKAFVLAHLGHTLAQMGELGEAESSLLEGLKIRQDLGEEALIMDTFSGLALVRFLKEDRSSALNYVNRILSWIKENGIEGLEFPVKVYLICYQVLYAAGEVDHQLQTMAETVLENGHALLMQRLERIKEEGMRQQFLEKVPYNRELHTAWLNSHE